jgi:hypothetical protein
LGKSSYEVVTDIDGFAPYSAYVEFGTGGLVNVPLELKQYALRFKGKGVKQINMQPQPYLYPAFVKGRKQYEKDLKTLLNRLTKKYN